MYARIGSTLTLILAALIVLSAFDLASAAEAEKKEIPAPAKAALTEQQRREAAFLGLNPDAGGVDLVLKRLSGGCDTNPYPELQSRYSLPRDAITGQPMKITPKAGADGSGSEGINPVLACRLLKLFQTLEKEQGCLIKISSAYRTNAEQARACGSGGTGCLGAGKSCHNYGLAVDIRGSCVGRLRAFLGQRNSGTPGAQRFALHFPYKGDHLQCSEDRVANCRSGNGCGGGFAINADTSGFPASGGVPTQSFAQQLRQWLNPQQQPAQQPPLAMQPLPQMQGITNAFNEPVQEVKPSVSDSLVKDGEKTGSTTADKLEDLAFGKKKETPAQTATTVPVYLDGSDIGGVASKGKANDGQPVTATAGIGGSVTQSTFGSDSLAWEDSQTNITGFQAILASIRNRLQAILSYLQPFGRPGTSREPIE